MKKTGKHDLVKITSVMVFIAALLTWVIPQGYFQNGEMVVEEITRVGIFDFFTYGLLGVYYFTVLVTLIFVIGAFYQVLSKIAGYQKLTTRLAEKLQGKEIIVSLAVSFIIALLAAVTNEYIILVAVAPFVITVLSKMNVDKLTSFVTTFGAILVGILGSIYSTKIVGVNVDKLQVEFATNMWPKVIIFVVAFVVYSVFNVLHIRKVKASENIDVATDMFEEKPAHNTKEFTWPLWVILTLTFVVSVLAYMPWTKAFNVELFETVSDAVLKFKLFDSPVISYILGTLSTFGNWDIFGVQVLMLIAMFLIKAIYKMSTEDFIDAIFDGFKKIVKVVGMLLLTYIVLELSVMYPVAPTVVKAITELTDKFNVLLVGLSGLITSAFTVEYQYTVSLIGEYFVTLFEENTDQIALALQSTYGLVSVFVPSSAILMMGLSYLGISYKEWMKYIWAFLLIMVAVVAIVLLLA